MLQHRPLDYGMPMRMCYDVTEDQDLTGDVLSEMVCMFINKIRLYEQFDPFRISICLSYFYKCTYNYQLFKFSSEIVVNELPMFCSAICMYYLGRALGIDILELVDTDYQFLPAFFNLLIRTSVIYKT